MGFKIIFFVQSSEWKYCSNYLTRNIVKFSIAKSFVISDILIYTNSFLKEEYENEFISCNKINKKIKIKNKSYVYPIWTDENKFESKIKSFKEREIDILICLRYGYVKAPEKYVELIKLINNRHPNIRIVAFCPSNFFDNRFSSLNLQIKRGITIEERNRLYNNSKFFISLSRFEGFGLTIIESMSFGSIPLVLDNVGCKNYMSAVPELIVDKNASMEDFLEKFDFLSSRLDINQKVSEKVFNLVKDGYRESKIKRNYAIKKILKDLENF